MSDLTGGIFFLGFLFVVGAVIHEAIKSKKKAKHESQWNYRWYVGEFPELCRDGVVRCYQCHSSKLAIHLSESLGLRAHVCVQCGTRLYYSINVD